MTSYDLIWQLVELLLLKDNNNNESQDTNQNKD